MRPDDRVKPTEAETELDRTEEPDWREIAYQLVTEPLTAFSEAER